MLATGRLAEGMGHQVKVRNIADQSPAADATAAVTQDYDLPTGGAELRHEVCQVTP